MKKLDVYGKCDLFDILKAAPNLCRLAIQYDCLSGQLNDKDICNLLQQRIVRLHIMDWTNVEYDLLDRTAVIFTSLYELLVSVKNEKLFVNEIAIKILSLWQNTSLFSVYINGGLSNEVEKNLRQWFIDHSHLTNNSSFAVKYNNNWLDLWI